MLGVLQTLCAIFVGAIAVAFVLSESQKWVDPFLRNFTRVLAALATAALCTSYVQSYEYASLEAAFQNPAEAIAQKDAEIAELKRELSVERESFDHLEDRMSMMRFSRQVVWRGWMPFQLIRGPEAVVYQDVILESEDTCSVVRPCLVTDYDSDLCPFDLTMLVWQ